MPEELLETARKNSDRARDKLESAAQQHAYFLAEVEKLVLAMNRESVDEVRDEPEA